MESNISPLLTVGVISDTHIPDRVERVQPRILDGLRAAGVNRILHAGDISIPLVLAELERIAPVEAVRGNRDLVFGQSLPLVKEIDLAGVRVALMHGHGSWWNYWRNKMIYWRYGYVLDRYIPVLIHIAPEAQVIVFGHTHHPENIQFAGRLLFNPGSASASLSRHLGPSYGLLRIYEGGKVEGEIVRLNGCEIKNRRWVER